MVEIATLRKNQALDAATNGLVYTCEALESATEGIATAVVDGETLKIAGESYGKTVFIISTVYHGEPIAAELTVNVCNLDVVIQLADLEIENGNYVVDVSTENIEEYKNTFTPIVEVYEHGQLNESAAPVWSIEDEKVATIDAATGEIVSVNRGTTLAKAVFEGLEICVCVNVFRPECVLENTPVDVEILTGKYEYRLPELRGSVESVLLEGKDVLERVEENGRKLVLDKSRLNFTKKEMGDKRLKIVTDRVVYMTTALVYSKVLRTAQDLDEMGFWAKLADERIQYWDGYFALGNDISYTGEYSSFISWKILNEVGYGDKFYEGEYCGFCGTLDGRGYNIDGLTMSEGSSGLVGVLTIGGVVKNISFTNVRLKAYSSLVCATGCGRIENVYVQCISQEGGLIAGNKQNGFFFSVFSMSTAVVKNCFIETSINLKIEAADATFGVGSFISEGNGYASLQGVYVIGTEFGAANGWGRWAKVDNIAGRYGAYATKDALLAEVDFSGWTGDFWILVKGKPIPKNLAPEPDCDNTAQWDENW